jgi:hypothetical protein
MDYNSTSSQRGSDEFIEIAAVLTWISRSRRWWMTGAVVFGVFGALISIVWKPTTYVTLIPYLLESSPPLESPGLVSRFNDVIGRKDVVQKISEIVERGEQKPVMGGSIFAERQMRQTSDRLVPLKAVLNEGRLAFQWASTQEGDPSQDIMTYTTAAMSVLRAVNKNFVEAAAEHSKDIEHSSVDPVVVKMLAMEAAEELAVRSEMRNLQTKLKFVSLNLPDSENKVDPEGEYLEVLVRELPKIPAAQRQDVIEQYSALVGKYRAIKIKYRHAELELEAQVRKMSSGVIESAGMSAGTVPIFRVDPVGLRELHVKVQNLTPFYVTLGIIFGIFSGAISYHTRNLLRRGWSEASRATSDS